MKHLVLILLSLTAVIGDLRAQSHVILVRHAEKAEGAGVDPKDPDLSATGRARAETLARVLCDAHITAVYATEFKRTQQTATPLARAVGVETTIVPASATDALVVRLRESKGAALVVGHSNTIPELIRKLGIESPATIAESDYDNLYVVSLSGSPQLLQLHY